MSFDRKNKDEDGFTYGFYWGGENGKINDSLNNKRKSINANDYNIEKSIKLIQEIFKEVSDSFSTENEYSSISESFDLTIQTIQGTQFMRNYKKKNYYEK